MTDQGPPEKPEKTGRAAREPEARAGERPKTVRASEGVQNSHQQKVELTDFPDVDPFEQTQSIHLDSLFTGDVTVTESFSFGGLDQTWFGKMLHALPIPALLVDEACIIVFMNRAWSRINPDYVRVFGRPLPSLFANVWIGKEAESAIQNVLSARQPESVQGAVQIGPSRMWGRLHFRSVRVGANRSFLVLVEDLTLEKEQLLLKQQHENEMLKEQAELEHRVQERTAELVEFTKRLRREIAERKRTEERYRRLLENAPVGIISCDAQGNIIEYNTAVTEILGAPSAEATVELNLLTFSSPVEARVSATIRKCLETGEPIVNEFPYRSQWGKQIYAILRAVPIRGPDDRITGVQAVIEDISDQKWAEGLRLRSLSLKAMVEMAAAIAKDFRDSLETTAAKAQTVLDCLESGNVSAARPLVERIRDWTHKAVQTVSQLERFADLQPGRDFSQQKVFDLSDAVREGIERSRAWWETSLQSRGVKITLDTELSDNCWIAGERKELVDVAANLVRNAAEALSGGGRIRVGTYVREDQVFLEVEDTGVGIPKEDLDKIFEPFWTSKGSRPGMGLAVSSGIVGRHRGTISVTSKEGEATRFIVRLPAAEGPVTEAGTQAGPGEETTFRILLIHDDRPEVRGMEEGFGKLRQTTLVASTGEEALRIIRSTDVDAVVCNLMVHGESAWAVSRQIQAVCAEKGVFRPPVLMLTPSSHQVAEEDLLAHPYVDRVIEKPVQASRLLEIIGEEVRGAAASDSFSGRIHSIDLLEYIQLVLLTKQQAVVEVRSREGAIGRLYIDRGTVRHATCGNLTGEDAFHRCVKFRAGSFVSLPWSEPEQVTVNKPGEFLLFEAARKRDEMFHPEADQGE